MMGYVSTLMRIQSAFEKAGSSFRTKMPVAGLACALRHRNHEVSSPGRLPREMFA